MNHIISSNVLAIVISTEKNNNGANFTLKSIKTGKDFTYKISRKSYKGNWYTHISVEKNYLEFDYLGSYFKGKIFKKGSVNNSDSSNAIAFVLGAVEAGRFDFLDSTMELMHTGNCLTCGKELTDASSIERGLGPICASR